MPMPENAHRPQRPPGDSSAAAPAPTSTSTSTSTKAAGSIRVGESNISVPFHSWLTSPARSHPNAAQAKELPLHLIQLILTHLDDAADLARVTRTSRLFYYMTLPRLYEHVTLRSYAEIRYVNEGRPEGYGSGSPFAMGLNTLVARTFTDYVQSFRVVGEWREHDVDDYKQGRVPDNSMVLQIAMRAALDRMKRLHTFAWELNTKPLNTLYQGLVNRSATLTSFTLRCQTKRIPRPTTIISPLPNLRTLVVYDIDPLCYPDDFSLLLAGAKKLENLKLHWSPRMRDSGEESVSLMTLFSRCMAARSRLPVKRMAIYNLYTRYLGFEDGFEHVIDPTCQQEVTVFNSMGSQDPMTVFLDNSWRVNNSARPVPPNLKMLRTDQQDKEQAVMFSKFTGLERLYLVSRRNISKTSSTAATPTTPSTATPGMTNGTTSAYGTPTMSESQCRSVGGDYLAVIQSHHRTMRHLLLPDRWVISDTALYKLCQACPRLEQLGFASSVPPWESLRQIIAFCPKLWAIRMLVRPGSEFAETISSMDPEMHAFALATEFWRPEYRNVKYVGLGENIVYKLGGVVFPPKNAPPVPEGQEKTINAKMAGPKRRIEILDREKVKWIEIWGLDTTEFDPKFP
ncbi:hypothetical protein FB567DRAFT_227191 [Paraphoma chrysanthemicola]|uniref:F-box domain-containing protein n=1 Tax=Paraphoma chrysanthemicola TaxID=798071 RepID=A0A8K0W1L2_9PLEO|nr:hypothetical protein FB567DRAFT_227191 [Paraphoma chrysanthemicola]